MTLLFEDESPRPIARTKPVPSAFFSLLVHLGVVTLLLWLSFSPDVFTIPDNLRRTMLVAPLPPPPPPPPPPTSIAVKASVRSAPSRFTVPIMAKLSPNLPSSKDFVLADEPPVLEIIGSAPGGVIGGLPGGVSGGVPGGLPTFSGPVAIASPAVPTVKVLPAPPVERIQVSPAVQEAMLLTMVKPLYPAVAKQARIQGAVHLKAIIDREGRIAELKVIDGHPFLVDAAVAAVRTWRYRPTLHGGEPVEVGTQITVHFRLENLK